MGTADAYAESGFLAVVQDALIGTVLVEVPAMVRTRPLRLVVHGLRTGTPRLGLWLDTSDQSAQETVATILARLDEALVDEIAGG